MSHDMGFIQFITASFTTFLIQITQFTTLERLWPEAETSSCPLVYFFFCSVTYRSGGNWLISHLNSNICKVLNISCDKLMPYRVRLQQNCTECSELKNNKRIIAFLANPFICNSNNITLSFCLHCFEHNGVILMWTQQKWDVVHIGLFANICQLFKALSLSGSCNRTLLLSVWCCQSCMLHD